MKTIINILASIGVTTLVALVVITIWIIRRNVKFHDINHVWWNSERKK